MTETAQIEVDKHLFESTKPEDIDWSKRYIQSSPYSEQGHLLDLDTLDYEYRVFALALQSFKVATDNYAEEEYFSSFNIDEVVSLARHYADDIFKRPLKKFRVHVIAFRSILHEEVQTSSEKRELLGQVDSASHREANMSGGLLKYFFGTPNSNGKNLATCWWVDENYAKRGGKGPAHRNGISIVRDWYKFWQIEQYALQITNSGYYTFERI